MKLELREEFEAPLCCNTRMKLITSYFNDGNTWYIFQCPLCGKVLEGLIGDNEEDDETEEIKKEIKSEHKLSGAVELEKKHIWSR